MAVNPAARRFVLPLVALACAGLLAGCNGTVAAIEPALSIASSDDGEKAEGRTMIGKPYKVGGRWYHPKKDEDYDKTGLASWYGPGFHGKRTANGERFNQNALTAAHPTLPLPSYVRVTNAKSGKSAVLRINDRGPFKRGRIIDVSKAAAKELGFKRAGHAKVRVEYLGPAPVGGGDKETLVAAKKYGTKSKSSGGLRDFLPFGRGDGDKDEGDERDVNVRVASVAPSAAAAPAGSDASNLPGVAPRYMARRPLVEPRPTASAFADSQTSSEGAIDAVIAMNAPPEEPAPIEAQPLPETAQNADEQRVLGAFDMFQADNGSGIVEAKSE